MTSPSEKCQILKWKSRFTCLEHVVTKYYLFKYVSIWKSVKCNPVFNLEMKEHFHATAYHFGYIIYRQDIHYCFDKLVHSPLIT